MQIDWITVAAQIVNFLILVWLLKHFLYGRIIDAMDKREARIRERLKSAEQREQAAKDEAERYESQRQDLEREKEDTLAAARREADEIRSKFRDEARDEVDEQRRRWLKELETERDEVIAELRKQIARHTAHAARRALSQLADAELEQQVVKLFLKRLHALDEDERNELAHALEGKTMRITSAFDVPAKLRGEVEKAVANLLGGEPELRFETADEPVCGLEIAVEGRKLGWSIADYLAGLEKDLEAALRPSEKVS